VGIPGDGAASPQTPADLPASGNATAIAPVAPQVPRDLLYRELDGATLHAFVFAPTPADSATSSRTNAILLFHGGGWGAGSPEWTFTTARRFADHGLVAIAVQYRLSQGAVTPIDALDDVCAAFAWVRANAGQLGVTGRVAGYGVSAGGHLVAAAATIGCDDGIAGPDALLLWSPALDVDRDGWFAGLLQGRAKAIELSPVEHVKASTPPTCIVQGERDTLTPLSGAQRFHDLVVTAGGTCELNVHPGLGHLLTRNLANQEGDYDPDPAARTKGIQQHMDFLKRLGFIE
jgi:acetyl esterase/lipase